MRDAPLAVPLFLNASVPDPTDPALPIEPTHIAVWDHHSVAGPSRRVALAAPDNSIWIHTTPHETGIHSSGRPAGQKDVSVGGTSIPRITTTRSGSSTPLAPPRPANPRHSSFAGHASSTSRAQAHSRSRAPSTASSILSSSSRRRASAFSPPATAVAVVQGTSALSPTIATATATSTAVTVDAETGGQAHSSTSPHTHPSNQSERSSLSERGELLDHLREQVRNRSSEDSGRHVGLGLGLGIGLGRKLPVHGQNDHDKSSMSGTTSPRSVRSMDVRTSSLGGLMSWAIGDGEGEKAGMKEQEEDLQQQMEEVEVEREMERGRREEMEEKEGMEKVMLLKSPRSPLSFEHQREELKRTNTGRAKIRNNRRRGEEAIRRVYLPRSRDGEIVCLKVVEELGVLAVLRDTGSLNIISLATLEVTASIQLEAPEQVADQKPSTAASSSKIPVKLAPFWQWRDLHLAPSHDKIIIIAEGLPWPCGLPSHNGEVTRVVMLSPASADSGRLDIVARLELPGQGSIAVCPNESNNYLLHATSTSLTSYPIRTGGQPDQATEISTSVSSSSTSRVGGLLSVPNAQHEPLLRSATPNPGVRPSAYRTRSTQSLREGAQADQKDKGFAKFLASRRADRQEPKLKDDVHTATIGIGEGVEVVRNGYGAWRKMVFGEHGEGLGLADDAVDIIECDGKRLNVKSTITLTDNSKVLDAVYCSASKTACIRSADTLHIYQYEPTRSDRSSVKFTLKYSTPSSGPLALAASDAICHVSKTGLFLRDPLDAGDDEPSPSLLFSKKDDGSSQIFAPLDPDHIVVADSKGDISKRQLMDVLQNHPSNPDENPSIDRLDAAVTCLSVFQAGKTYVAAGDEDGAVRIWDAKSFSFCGSWTLFDDPVEGFALLDTAAAGHLRDHLLCVSKDGTIGIISLSEMEHLFLIPASRAPLRRIFLGGKDILLAYANGKARVWNVETMEFRRSTGLDAADDMLASGTWAAVDIYAGSQIGPLTSGQPGTDSPLVLHPRQLAKWMQDLQSSSAKAPLDALRGLLSLVMTFGVDEGIDRICTEELAIMRPKRPVLLGRLNDDGSSFTTIYAAGKEAWYISSTETGMRQLLVVTLLRPFLDDLDLERWAAEVIAYYTTSLPADVVPSQLEFFARYYLDTCSDVHQAARMLFAARLDAMSEAEIEVIVSCQQPHLPTVCHPDWRNGETAAQALLMIGGIALHKYQVINPAALKAAADSLLLYLHDLSSPHIPLAIELCAKGFTTWQTFVDPMELLRQLFHLATLRDSGVNSNSNSTSSSAAAARLAVLHVASSNPALFMSTLSMDILDAKSAEGRKSIMKLCVFMARKRPTLLEHGLPRIAEAVVKSLDPNVGSGKMRDDVWEAATVILNELVLAFSTIDFHSGTQKLAVGTSEGAVIMYDLKTASRLYVLEPHHKPVSSVTFSPDGRRLITVSLEEGCVTVWKVGSSLSGFFNVGGLPRQGGLGLAGGSPFKRIEFARSDDGPLESTSALSDIHVSWPGPRQARVNIKEMALTFET